MSEDNELVHEIHRFGDRLKAQIDEMIDGAYAGASGASERSVTKTPITVYVVSIDIKDGVYDVIHAFDNRKAAEEYVEWQEAHSGDHCYVSELPVEDRWEPSSP